MEPLLLQQEQVVLVAVEQAVPVVVQLVVQVAVVTGCICCTGC